MEYEFIVASKVTAEADFKTGKSKMVSCDVQLIADDQIEAPWKNNGLVNQAGMKVQTQGLIQGLVANIHWAHQMGYWDSAEHLRYIIENLERGFSHAHNEATVGKF
ncbi:MAG: hypothetical protein AAFP77_19655 [Bacteroidota bacterium]